MRPESARAKATLVLLPPRSQRSRSDTVWLSFSSPSVEPEYSSNESLFSTSTLEYEGPSISNMMEVIGCMVYLGRVQKGCKSRQSFMSRIKYKFKRE